MDESCSSNYAYISCCIILLINIIYLGFTSIKIFLQHRRRRPRVPRRIPKMTDNPTDTSTPSSPSASRMTTRSTSTSASTSKTTVNNKTGYERLAQLYPHVGEDTRLPSKWNAKEKPSALVLQQNDLVVMYKGPGKSHKDAASVRADHPIPPLTGIYYFEVKILSKGRDGFIGIGLSTSEVNLNRLPGWDKGSFGYHGDDGNVFCSSGTGGVYGPTYTTGDYVGCCVNFIENTCFYTRNGYNLGTSCRDIPPDIYPTVGLQTPNEAIEANFGLSPFKFDIEKYMDEYREKTRRSVMNCTLKEGELLHQTQLRRIVSTYLVHYGYCATAEQFNKNAESVYADELNSMRNRQLIQHLILDGRTTDAIEKTRELFPTLLNDTQLLFVLKVRQFIEMVNGTESEIRPKSVSSPSSSSSGTTTISHLNHHQNSPSTTPKNLPSYATSSERSSSPSTKTSKTSRSRSNSPYTAGRTSQSSSTGAPQQQQHANGTTTTTTTITSTSRRSSTNEPSDATNTHPTTNPIVNLMDIDDNHSSATNGYNHHGTVTTESSISNGHSLLDDDSTNLVVEHNSNTNGYSKKSSDHLDGMDEDGYQDGTHQMEMDANGSSDVQKNSTKKDDDQLLVRILQFGRELHALKQQLTAEHGENPQNDKLLQDAFSLLAYSDPKQSPLAYLLEPSQRETVSSAVNSAILEAHDMPRHPALEVLVGYLTECDKLMHKNNIPDCAFIDLKKYLR